MKIFNSDRRSMVALAVFLAILIAGIAAAGYFSGPNLIKEADVNLSVEEREQAETLLASSLAELSNLSKDAAPGDKVEPYFKKGQALHTLGKYSQARKSLAQALELDAGRRDVWFAKFEVERQMQDYPAAEKSVQSALFINDQVAEYWLGYIEMKRDNMNTPNLEELYTQALFKTGFNTSLLISYAEFKEKNGDIGGALNAHRLALQSDPENEEIKSQIERLEELAAQQ